MTSVFGNVFQMSGGASVWGNVFVLGEVEATEPTDGWVARSSSRTVSGGLDRVVAAPEMNRVVVAYVERR